MRFVISVFLIFVATWGGTAFASTSQQKFNIWLERKMWPLAKKEGVTRTTFDTACRGVTLNLKISGLDSPV